MVRKPTNRLITFNLKSNIIRIINSAALAQLVQVVVNTIYLENSIELLESHLLNTINANSSKLSGKLQGISIFRDLRHDAETLIYERLNTKINELLDLESFNWSMNELQGQASDYMKSLLSFLTSTLDSLSHLPPKLASTCCMSSCKYIGRSILNYLVSPELKQITFGAIEQLNFDLLQCETFANLVKIEGLNNETLSLSFADIRQLIDLILTKEWSIYLKDYGKDRSKYNRVNLNNAFTLVEKFVLFFFFFL
jgi:exocyst complex component 6